MPTWIKIVVTIFILALPLLFLTLGNGVAVDSKIQTPGLGMILVLGIAFAIRAIWRWNPVKKSQGTNLDSKNIEEEKNNANHVIGTLSR